jgi:pyruvate kinase
MLSGETAAGSFPVEAVRVMSKICREAEVSIDHYQLFKSILAQVAIPMAPLESLASSAVRTAQKAGPGGCCSPRYGMPSNSGVGGVSFE